MATSEDVRYDVSSNAALERAQLIQGQQHDALRTEFDEFKREIRSDFVQLHDAIADLGKNFAARGRITWPMLMGLPALMTIILSGILWLINSQLAPISTQFAAVQQALASQAQINTEFRGQNTRLSAAVAANSQFVDRWTYVWKIPERDTRQEAAITGLQTDIAVIRRQMSQMIDRSTMPAWQARVVTKK